MISRLSNVAWLAVLALCASGPALGQTCKVSEELWERARSGPAIAGDPALAPCIAAYAARPGPVIVHHPRSEDALLYAEELRTWLIALAIEPGRIQLREDLPASSPLSLEVPDDNPGK